MTTKCLRPKLLGSRRFLCVHFIRRDALGQSRNRRQGQLPWLGASTRAAPNALARYLPPELYELIGSADLVVAGTIIEVQETHFVLRFDEVLAGQAEAKVVVVRKFVDWACATRSKPYAVGQKEVAFLIRPDSRRPSVGEDFILMSAGAEAEWEIFGDTVVATGYPIDGYDAAPAGQAGQELPLKAVLNAIRRYRTCFAVEGWFGAGHRSIEQICDEKKLRAYRAGSPFHRHLVAISEVAIKAQSSSAEKSTPTAHER